MYTILLSYNRTYHLSIYKVLQQLYNYKRMKKILLYLYAVIKFCFAKPKTMMNAQIACELLSTLAAVRAFACTLGRVGEYIFAIAINDVYHEFEKILAENKKKTVKYL